MPKNPNSINSNEKSNEANTGWESVAAEAGKMRAPEPGSYAEFEQQDHESRDFIADKEQELANLREQIKKLAKTPNFPGVSGSVNSATLKEREQALREEIENARWERQARRNDRRDMAGIISAQLYGEGAKTGQLGEQENEQEDEPHEEATSRPSRRSGLFSRFKKHESGVERQEQEEMSFSESYDAYKRQIRKEQAHDLSSRNSEMAGMEHARGRLAIRHKEAAEKHYSEGKTKKERDQAFSDIKKAIKELHRYGYSENGNDAYEFKLVKETHPRGKELKEYGNSREENYLRLQFCLNNDGRSDRSVKKALKKAGFSKLPEKVDDKNFTSYEISQMLQIAENQKLLEEFNKKQK